MQGSKVFTMSLLTHTHTRYSPRSSASIMTHTPQTFPRAHTHTHTDLRSVSGISVTIATHKVQYYNWMPAYLSEYYTKVLKQK